MLHIYAAFITHTVWPWRGHLPKIGSKLQNCIVVLFHLVFSANPALIQMSNTLTFCRDPNVGRYKYKLSMKKKWIGFLFVLICNSCQRRRPRSKWTFGDVLARCQNKTSQERQEEKRNVYFHSSGLYCPSRTMHCRCFWPFGFWLFCLCHPDKNGKYGAHSKCEKHHTWKHEELQMKIPKVHTSSKRESHSTICHISNAMKFKSILQYFH